jgi:RNA polymerase sigma factor (sigma-70 family)
MIVMMGRSGEDETFRDAFGALFPPAFRLAYRVLGNASQAEDAAAEALARAFASWRKVWQLPYRDAWVMRVTVNVAVDMLRRQRPPVASQASQPDLADAAVLRVTLAQALARLPKRQRQVVALRYLSGLSEAEVGECLRLSTNTVKIHARRGTAALRRRLGDAEREVSLAPDRP